MLSPSFDWDERLLSLPQLTRESEVIKQWIEVVIYPFLQEHKRELEKDPRLENKAKDDNGKFQLSRLKVQIHETTTRLAALPVTYYIDVG